MDGGTAEAFAIDPKLFDLSRKLIPPVAAEKDNKFRLT
jgi:hypothetical protein